MLLGVGHECRVGRFDEFLEISGREYALFVLFQLFGWCHIAIESVGEENLEDDVENHHEGEKDASSEE